MRPDTRWRLLEIAVLAVALAGTCALGWAGYLAVTQEPVPGWVWVFIGAVAVVGLAVVALDGGRHGADDGSFRHNSGELVIVRGYRERRNRGTRVALDWKYGLRGYLLVPTVMLLALASGFDLLSSGIWWQALGGALVVLAVLVIAALIVRWLLLPVDVDSKARLDEEHENMRWDWSWMWKPLESLRSRNRRSR